MLWHLATAVVGQSIPIHPLSVTMQPNDRRIWVSERRTDNTLGQPYAFAVKGVNWSPASINSPGPAVDLAGMRQEFFNWYLEDIPRIAAMGANTVRTYIDFGGGAQARTVLDLCYKHGLKVILTVDVVDLSAFATVEDREDAKVAHATSIVNDLKTHPAILMWAVGNEWDANYHFLYGPTNPNNILPPERRQLLVTSAQFTNRMALAVKAVDTVHPVASFTKDPHIPHYVDSNPPHQVQPYHYLDLDTAPWAGTGEPVYARDVLGEAPAVDVWGLQVYRNRSFSDVFAQWARISTKPMIVGEFGTDAYDHDLLPAAGENQTLQNTVSLRLWDEVKFNLAPERTSGIALGGLLFEWNDEWWKNIQPGVHNPTTEINPGHPDRHNDEEWFGLVDIQRNPRLIYQSMTARFQLGGEQLANLIPNPQIAATSSQDYSSFSINGVEVYYRENGNGGGRGFNVAVLDDKTGFRMRDYRHVDTWYNNNGSKHPDLVAYLNAIPNDSIVLLSICDNGGMDFGLAAATEALLQTSDWGSTLIGSVSGSNTWAMISKKGTGMLAEAANTTFSDPVTISTTVNLTLDTQAGRRQIVPAHDTPVAMAFGMPGGNFDLGFQARDGFVYRIEYAIDLVPEQWQPAQRWLVGEDIPMGLPPIRCIGYSSLSIL